jgi:hypothetical protein
VKQGCVYGTAHLLQTHHQCKALCNSHLFHTLPLYSPLIPLNIGGYSTWTCRTCSVVLPNPKRQTPTPKLYIPDENVLIFKALLQANRRNGGARLAGRHVLLSASLLSSTGLPTCWKHNQFQSLCYSHCLLIPHRFPSKLANMRNGGAGHVFLFISP